MTIQAMVIAARSAGVVLHVRDGERVTLTGQQEAVSAWAPKLKPHKAQVLELLRIEHAEQALRAFAERCGIPWPSARAYLTDADVLAGANCLEVAERLQDPAELRMVQGWLASLNGVPWKG